jgi:hypothetical protein
MTVYRIAAAILALTLSVSSAAVAQQTKAPEVQLTPDEIKEKELRKSCKVALCSAFLLKKADGPDVSCGVLKTWRKEQLTKMVSKGGVSWPWGAARCTADLKFKRADLVKAMTEPAYDLAVDKHNISCELDRESDKYEVKMEIAPKVSFKDGKAIKAQMNWGKVDAPLLAKSVLWSATAADNTFGALQGTVVEDINDFIGVKCLEVKDELK